MRLVQPIALTATAAALSALAASARTDYDGDVPGGRLGERFDVLGDVDGDGAPDLVASDPGDGTGGIDAGRVLVLSGATGALVREHFGAAAGDRLGEAIVALDDFDGDGVRDYAAGAPEANGARGHVTVFSGATGAVLASVDGASPGDRFGASVDRVGDVNGDTRSDFAIGAPGFDEPGAADAGRVVVLSGASGFLIHDLGPLAAARAGLRFGLFVSDVGDLDGDGLDDVLASSPELDGTFQTPGHVAVFSGATGAPLLDWIGLDGGHGDFTLIGSGVDGAGDVNGDGVPDLLIGVSLQFSGHEVWLIDGATGQTIWKDDFGAPGDYVGDPVNLGDVSGDGVPDQAYLMPFAEVVRVVSGANGLTLQELTMAGAGLDFGADIRGVDDVTGDGIRDILVGVPGFDGPAGADSGLIRVFEGCACELITSYCIGGVNSTGGRARMAHSGTGSVSANDLVLSVSGAPAGQFGLFAYASGHAFTPLGEGFLCLGGDLHRLNPVIATDAQGAVAFAVDLTAPPTSSGPGAISPGEQWRFQFWFRDAPQTSNLSDGLLVPFCP